MSVRGRKQQGQEKITYRGASEVLLLLKYYYGDKIKDGDMDGTHSTHEERNIYCWQKNLKERAS
jgi:hypothetical protein